MTPDGVTPDVVLEELLSPFEIGLLIGVLVGEGSFGGDGRQACITVRMHTRHESIFQFLSRSVPGSRLYGPYNHGGRSHFQWMCRGSALIVLSKLLDRWLTIDIDEHAFRRYADMKTAYRIK